MAENWIDQVPGATRTVKDRESGAPLILDDKGHAWREDPDHPGTPQDIGKWMPSLMDVMQNPEKESKTTQDFSEPSRIAPTKPVQSEGSKGPEPGSDKFDGPVFNAPETEIKGKKPQRKPLFRSMSMPKRK